MSSCYGLEKRNVRELIIVGAGAAGSSAAIYASLLISVRKLINAVSYNSLLLRDNRL